MPPHIASLEGNEKIVQMLEQGDDINTQCGYLGNAMQAASLKGGDKIVQTLLEKGVKLNSRHISYDLPSKL